MLRKIIRAFVIETSALYLVLQIAQGLVFAKGIQSLIITGIALALASFLIRPVINILLLPINLITFNFFKWASHAVTLFLVDLVLTEFAITSFTFRGLNSDYLSLPQIFFEQGVVAYLAFSILIATIANAIYWVVEK